MRSGAGPVAADTNILVRLIANDDANQRIRAAALFEQQQVWLSKSVLLETEWVLRSLYEIPPHSIGSVLRKVAGLPGVLLEAPDEIERALNWFDQGWDFADALHVASIGPAAQFATFDRKLARNIQKLRAARIAAV